MDLTIEDDLLDIDLPQPRRNSLKIFSKYLTVNGNKGVVLGCTLCTSVLQEINLLYEQGQITKLQRSKIKAHILRQSDPHIITNIEEHYRRRSLLANSLPMQSASLETVLTALEDSAVASPIHLYDEDDVVLLMGVLYKKRRTGLKAGKWDKRYGKIKISKSKMEKHFSTQSWITSKQIFNMINIYFYFFFLTHLS